MIKRPLPYRIAFIKVQRKRSKSRKIIIAIRRKSSKAKTEKEEGFAEAVKTIKDQKQLNFFYLGKKNDWKELLNPKIEKKIRESFLKEMKEIGYI